MEVIWNGPNGRNVLQLVVGEPVDIQELAPNLSQKIMEKLVLNRSLAHLVRLKSATPRNVVRT